MRGVALLRLSTTIDLTRVFPQPLVTTDNAETRDLGLKTREGVRRPRRPYACGRKSQCFARNTSRNKPVVARLSVLLVARDYGIKCAFSMVADSAGARPRKAGQVNGLFVRFLKFRRPQRKSL